MDLTPEQQLKIISAAWGRQTGYCFFPWIEGRAATKSDRINSYHEEEAFEWPKDRAKIIAHLKSHPNDDVYWCPSLFEFPRRRLEFAMDEHCLWADLDEVDPRTIERRYKPTVAWESSHKRYQALWLIAPGFDIQGASWQGRENQQLTYYLKADTSGWDTTQLLRIPGWLNHKPDRRSPDGTPYKGRLLWNKPRDIRFMPDDFMDLPELEVVGDQLTDILEDQIDAVDRREVWGKYRLKVSNEVRQLVRSQSADGDRSSKLWQIERDLADAGCTVPEIVSIVRETVWNKYIGRSDELRRLVTEAGKAIQARGEKTEQRLEAEREGYARPVRLMTLLRGVAEPDWLVKDIWALGGLGFLAGQPKSWKSWFALDMALSVATGAPFLGKFDVRHPGPVLYIQEEDSAALVKAKVAKILPTKFADRMEVVHNNGKAEVLWHPPAAPTDPDIDAVVRERFTLSEPSWQEWLDEVLSEGFDWDGREDTKGKRGYRLVVIDSFMASAGDVEENRSTDLNNKIFGPMREINEKHHVGLLIVHHMRKPQKEAVTTKPGSQMLGSVAHYAWAENGLYITPTRRGLSITVDSKTGITGKFIVGNLREKGWGPRPGKIRDIIESDEEETSEATNGSGPKKSGRPPAGKNSKIYQALAAMGPGTHRAMAIWDVLGRDSMSKQGLYQGLHRLEESQLIESQTFGRIQRFSISSSKHVN